MSDRDWESAAELAINGGEPVRTERWPTYEDGTGPASANALRAVEGVLSSGLLFRYDARPVGEAEAAHLEKELAEYFGVDYALAVSSGTAALALALMGADLPKRSRVGCPAFGFPATASAVLLAGHEPVLIGVDDNLHFDVEDFKKRLVQDLKAVIVVHMRGFASPIDSVLRACADSNVVVIEDAVPALGASYHGRHLGTFGVAGCFSTQSDKSINTGEGGFLITNSRPLFERAVLLSGAFEGRHNHHFESTVDTGGGGRKALPLYNFRLDEIRAALARVELRVLDERVERLQHNYDFVTERLSEIPGLRLRVPVSLDRCLGDALNFFVDAVRADHVAEAITAEGVLARAIGSKRDHNVRAFWNWEFMNADREADAPHMARSVAALRSAIDIPLSPRLKRSDLEQVIRAITKVMRAEPDDQFQVSRSAGVNR